jgi:hypothetical protein
MRGAYLFYIHDEVIPQKAGVLWGRSSNNNEDSPQYLNYGLAPLQTYGVWQAVRK